MDPLASIFCSVLLGVVGQLVLKSGVSKTGPAGPSNWGPAAALWGLYLRPRVWCGLAVYGLSMLFWLSALSQVELGYAYPFISFSYVVIVLASRVLYHEEVSPLRLLGVASICLGILVISRG